MFRAVQSDRRIRFVTRCFQNNTMFNIRSDDVGIRQYRRGAINVPRTGPLPVRRTTKSTVYPALQQYSVHTYVYRRVITGLAVVF